MKEMVNYVPFGSCPICGHKQFIAVESNISVFLTDGDGMVVQSKELDHNVKGKCLNCNTEFDMLSTLYGFIPLTSLRKILLDYMDITNDVIECDYKNIDNPMAIKEGAMK